MGESIPLLLASLLSFLIMSIWVTKGPGPKKQRVMIFLVAMGALVIAWQWSIPSIYSSDHWGIFFGLSFFLVLFPLAIPSIWRRAH